MTAQNNYCRVVAQQADLDCLAAGSIIFDSELNTSVKYDDGKWIYWNSCSCHDPEVAEIIFPATVIYEGEDET